MSERQDKYPEDPMEFTYETANKDFSIEWKTGSQHWLIIGINTTKNQDPN
jgi:hypothetical protein